MCSYAPRRRASGRESASGNKLVKGREHLFERYDDPPKITVADGKS
jgi:hypothetical protein